MPHKHFSILVSDIFFCTDWVSMTFAIKLRLFVIFNYKKFDGLHKKSICLACLVFTTLRVLIFACIKFCEFREFMRYSRNFGHEKCLKI